MGESRPLYMMIQDYILDQIRKGNWKPDDQIPPERELAEQFQVSRITAKAAIVGLVNKGYLSRQRGKGTFVAHVPGPGKSLERMPVHSAAEGSKKLVGLIIPWVEFRYFSLLLSGVEEELSKAGYHLIVKRITGLETESQTIEAFLGIPVDALIIVTSPGEHFNEDIIRLVLDKYPVILVEKSMQDIRTNSVYCDAGKGGAMMAEYLMGKGVRKIGLVTYPPRFTFGVKARIFGFQSALVAGGVPPLSDDLILSVTPDLLQRSDDPEIPEEIIRFLSEHPELEAVATVDAMLAKLVGKACYQMGRTDMRIICFDEPSYSKNSVYPTAYIDQSPVEVGRIAVRLAMEALEGQQEPKKCVIEPRLVELS